MKSFTYEALPGRVVFGVGASREKLAEEVVRLGAERVLLVVTEREKEFAEELAAPLGDRVVGVFTNVRPTSPSRSPQRRGSWPAGSVRTAYSPSGVARPPGRLRPSRSSFRCR